MSQEIQTLIEMGFSKEKAEKAMEVTGNKGVEPAMEWLLAHSDDQSPSAGHTLGSSAGNQTVGSSTESSTTVSPTSSTDADSQVAKSLKCDECDKLFKNHDEVEFHAAKTGHSAFSESTEEKKPLSEEERKAQLVLLEEKMKARRKEREDKEKAEMLERERLRIKSGKDMQDAKQRMEELEMKKLIEQRKRDKLEEKMARDKVKAQIEADRLARKQAAQGINPGDVLPTPATPVPVFTPTVPVPQKTYDQARLQLRLPDGETLTATFGSKEQLAAVRLYLQVHCQLDDSFTLMTTFPKKIFTQDELEMPLDALGLTPSAVLIVTRPR